MKYNKLSLKVGIIRDENLQFSDKGLINLKCPNCGLPIDIDIKGLPDDLSLSPVIDYKMEITF